jgi:hypothetical protein
MGQAPNLLLKSAAKGPKVDVEEAAWSEKGYSGGVLAPVLV